MLTGLQFNHSLCALGVVRELACLTRLRHLEADTLHTQHLHLLSILTGLSHLSLPRCGGEWAVSTLVPLQGLTQLTYLEVRLQPNRRPSAMDADVISALRGMTGLQTLRLGAYFRAGNAVAAALAQLTRLTQLQLHSYRTTRGVPVPLRSLVSQKLSALFPTELLGCLQSLGMPSKAGLEGPTRDAYQHLRIYCESSFPGDVFEQDPMEDVALYAVVQRLAACGAPPRSATLSCCYGMAFAPIAQVLQPLQLRRLEMCNSFAHILQDCIPSGAAKQPGWFVQAQDLAPLRTLRELRLVECDLSLTGYSSLVTVAALTRLELYDCLAPRGWWASVAGRKWPLAIEFRRPNLTPEFIAGFLAGHVSGMVTFG